MKTGGTKLGAMKDDGTVSHRLLSSVFRSTASMRSMATLPQLTGIQQHPQKEELTEKEKQVVFSRDLKVADPQAPKNLVRMKFNTNAFEEITNNEEEIVVHMDRVGRIAQTNTLKIEQTDEILEEEEETGETEEKILRNQFNFSDRATQGKITIYIDQGTLTEAPQPKDCTGSTTQREIAAAYSNDKKSALLPQLNTASAVTRIMERVVNQNMDPNSYNDFRYFDDMRDTLTKDAGYTLPLWQFKADSVHGCGVAQIQWNPQIPDLFAASYGPVTTANDKASTQKGYICIWSLKNQITPKAVLELPAPAVAIDWNPKEPSMLAGATVDGNVLVFDARSMSPIPMYSTAKLSDRHASSVTVLRWQPPDTSGNHTLLSAAMDGRILMWTLIQNEMKMTEVAQLPGGIVAIDYFNENSSHYKVACDDGRIYHVQRTRTTQPPTSFDAHSPPISGISFNRFHSAVYASCGTDWSVKIWRDGETEPLQDFDYAPHYATDCQFAPHSSTVIGTVTSDGELFIYDLAVNRYQEICKTEVVEAGDGGLTSIRFHAKWPIILIGDDKGRVHAIKISPNLRRNTKINKEEAEKNKISKSGNSKDSRGLLPDLTQQQEDDDDGANAAAEEEAKWEALAHDESVKFEKCMGVSWINYPEVVSALPPA